ncbi:carboxymuconolactone decarboxylase family protein [Amycolatopsis umgeniensis]|uniref:Alkylhydroperoxidase family enzyme n=1 Tax=Amycolatopsis umgeniensis TaxID=336628 RepID=A0A841BGX5_9PSEU|nr:carboxymuconolactone decarboxylase family protein [Amycolatopsis umgeniensis]MBB5857812.1 alkylhydroperoxidase family enzyme [Amycolatopsis umgeniensis]
MARIAPLTPPYQAAVEEALRKWMPPGVAREPLALFRLLQHHSELASRMRVLGAGLLAHGELPALDREIVIARVTARCGCRYEWGVHAAVFASVVGLTPEQVEATVSGDPGHPAWSGRQRALIAAVDELHDTATVCDDTWTKLAEHFPADQLLEFLVLAGWYRTIAYVANGVGLEEEPWAAPYPDR